MKKSRNPMLWTEDIQAAADAVKHFCPSAVQHILQRAEELCGGEFLFADHWEMERTNKAVRFAEEINWQAVPYGDPEWTYAMNRHTSLLNLAKAWRLTKNDKYKETCVCLLDSWLTNVPHTQESEQTTWRPLEAGIRAENWLRMFLLLDKDLPASVWQRAEQSLWEHGVFLAREQIPLKRLSNWGAIQEHGLFLLGVWFSNTVWQQQALRRLTDNLEHAVLRDGVHWEQSPMYHCEVLHAAMDTLLIARQNRICVPPRLSQKVHQMCSALAAWCMPGRYILPQSDSDRIDAGDLLAQGAVLFEDPELSAAAQGPICEEILWDFGVQGIRHLKDIHPRRSGMASRGLEASGNYILRAGWGETDLCLHMHTGSLGGGHGHADLLHIDVYDKGEGILVDSGRATYVDNKVRRWLKSPAAHNTVRIDDKDFTTYTDSWRWEKQAQMLPAQFCAADPVDYVCGGHMGYLDIGCVVQRKVVFVKSGWIVVADIKKKPRQKNGEER